MSDCVNHAKILIKHIKLYDVNSQKVYEDDVNYWLCLNCQRLYDKRQIIELAEIAVYSKKNIKHPEQTGTQ